MRYPKELFVANETVTKENIRQYNAYLDRLYREIEKRCPDYWHKSIRERMVIKKKIKENMA